MDRSGKALMMMNAQTHHMVPSVARDLLHGTGPGIMTALVVHPVVFNGGMNLSLPNQGKSSGMKVILMRKRSWAMMICEAIGPLLDCRF